MDSLARTFRRLGQLKQAEEVQVIVLEKSRKLLGNDHPHTLATMHNLALTYDDLGQSTEAEKLKLVVLERRRKSLGDNHLDTLKAMDNLAITYAHLGRCEEAEKLQLAVLEKRRKILGDDHLDTLDVMHALVLTYDMAGRFEEAKNLQLAVLEKRRSILGDDHLSTLAVMGNLAVTYDNLGRSEEAEKLNLTVLEKRKKLLGDDHLDTLKAMDTLALTYDTVGRFEEAEKLKLVVLQKRRKLLGDDHLDTLKAMDTLALTYDFVGRFEEAEKLKLVVLQKRRKLLSDDHLDTLNAVQDHALLLHPPSSILSSQMTIKEKVSSTEPTIATDSEKVAGSNAPSASTLSATTDAEPERKKREYKEFMYDEEETTHANIDISTIELKTADIYDKEKVDLETIVIDDVLKILQCNEDGLTPDEVQHRLGLFGPNKLEQEEQKSPFLQFLSFLWNPLAWVMEAAAFVAIALSNGEGRAPDWQDFVGILLLLFINSAICFYEERRTGDAVRALMGSLAPKAKVKRSGSWSEIESADLVPGDMISFKIGDVVPADCRLTEAINVSIDQAALTGESLPQSKMLGDQCFSQGEAEGVVISTGANTFFGRAASLVGQDDDTTGHLQKILEQIGSFCLVTIGIFVVVEILVLYVGFKYSYRQGLDNILVLLIGGIPIAMPTVLTVTLAVGAQQLAKHKAIVTRIAAIEELAGVTILCSDKTGTLTTNKLTIDRETILTYSSFSADDVILLAAYASRTENQDAIDASVVQACGDPARARAGIELLDFKPFSPTDKRTEITYREEATGKLKRVTKGMTGTIIELCSRNRTEELEDKLEHDVEEYATRGLRALAVAYEELDGDDFETEGNGFELIGLLAIFDPPRSDTKQTIDDALALGVMVKMLAIAKETGRRLGLGDHMYPAKVLKDGPAPDGKYLNLDEMIMDADGFAGVFPEHKYEIVKRLQGLGHLCAMTGDGANDTAALSRANVGFAVEGATDAARGAADIVLTEPGLSAIVHAIRGSRIIFQRMRNYSIYACAMTIRIAVCFSIFAFAYKFDFPPFMILIIALLNDGTIMTLSVDRVLPSNTPDSWNVAEIFSYAVAYGLYLSLSTVSLVVIILKTSFFQDKFGVSLDTLPVAHNDPGLHMVVYLQVAIISQALIFVTRSHGFFFMERPSTALLGAFCIAQLISSIIAAYANWGFAKVHGISGGWIGIVWIWNIIWFIPLDWIKFAMRATVIKYLRQRHLAAALAKGLDGILMTRTQSRATSIHESLYSNRVSFIKRAARKVGFGQNISMKPEELQRFSSIQAQHVGATLARNPSRTAA
ncbi:hypothetical protein C8J57DRAFT_1523707 [Mycena rebaudengoi]|nr:hypothetical protein C8J57DRAFT_1523707 [Mycena rebaudengoi]